LLGRIEVNGGMNETTTAKKEKTCEKKKKQLAFL
jgi:hypothetical protein